MPHALQRQGFAVFLVLALALPAQQSRADSAGSAIGAFFGGVGKAASEIADRQIQQNQALELERERARLQLEYEKRRIEEESRRRQEADRIARLREEERQRQIAAQKEEEKRTAISTGSGFFVSAKGYLITNYHVIDDKNTYAIRDIHGKFYRAEVVARDAKNDLALMKVEGTFPALKVADSNSVSKGQRVLAVGYPQISIQGNESKVTDGIISAFSGLGNNDNWFQISVPIQGGNSGGPLVTESGVVVGVVVATVSATKFLSKTGNIPQNVNFAIKSNLVLDFMRSERVTNDATAKGKTSIDAVDKATVLVVAKNGTINVAFETTPPRPELTDRDRTKLAAEEIKKRKEEEAKQKREETISEKKRLAEEAAEKTQRRREQAAFEKRDRDVSRAFPNWQLTLLSETFIAWLKSQPPEAEVLARSPKASDLITVLKHFEADKPVIEVAIRAKKEAEARKLEEIKKQASIKVSREWCPDMMNYCDQREIMEANNKNKGKAWCPEINNFCGESSAASAPNTVLVSGSRCNHSSECRGTLSCIDNQCIHRCTHSSECPGSLSCANSRCIQR